MLCSISKGKKGASIFLEEKLFFVASFLSSLFFATDAFQFFSSVRRILFLCKRGFLPSFLPGRDYNKWEQGRREKEEEEEEMTVIAT